jgi:hypothetical protein
VAYALTPEGEKAFKPRGEGGFWSSQPGFCYGEPVMKEIVRFTEPGDMMGMTVSQVEYTLQLKNMPEWAKSKAMQAQFPQLAARQRRDPGRQGRRGPDERGLGPREGDEALRLGGAGVASAASARWT